MSTSQVITTVLVDKNMPHWEAAHLTSPEGSMVLVQTCDANIGFVGTPDQLLAMVGSIAEAVNNPQDQISQPHISVMGGDV